MKIKLGSVISEYSVRNKADEDIPVYSVTNDKGFCTGYFSKEVASKDKTTYKIVPHGYFAYNPSRINVGSVDWQHCEDRVIVSPLYVVFSVSPELDQRYLLHYLKSDITQAYIKTYATGSVRDNLKFSILSEFPINLPTLEEQRQIADILDGVSNIIDMRNQEVAELDELVKSRFLELFGSLYDEKFEMKSLPEIVSKNKNSIKRGPFGGALKKEDFVESGYLVYEQRHAIHNDFEYAKYYITKEKYEDMIGFKVVPGDLIISCSGVTLGRIAEIPKGAKEGIINQALLKISLNQTVMKNAFFIHQFRGDEIQEVLFGFSRGSGIPNMPSMNEVKAVKFICPPIELQEQFATFVEQTDKAKLAIQKSIAELEELKKSLMQKYFG